MPSNHMAEDLSPQHLHFMHSFIQYLLSICYMAGTTLSSMGNV